MSPEATPPLSPKTILIIDSDPEFSSKLVAMFELLMFEGVFFLDDEDTAAWITAVDQGKVRGNLPAVALLQLHLFPVTRRIRQSPILRNMVIIMFSNTAISLDTECYVRRYADKVLVGAFHLPTIRQSIAQLLEQRGIT